MCIENDLVPISALQHFDFCERQCALIHIEQLWAENRLTAEGRLMHTKVHETSDEARDGARIARGLRLRSLRLGLIGQADVVEFYRTTEGSWRPCPVEYKRGRPKPTTCDKVQLCAQAICLEEMLETEIPEGAIFYGQPRRRLPVLLNRQLREQTEDTAQRLHQLIASGVIPKAHYESKCRRCSLIDLCRPQTVGRGKSVSRYLANMLSDESGKGSYPE